MFNEGFRDSIRALRRSVLRLVLIQFVVLVALSAVVGVAAFVVHAVGADLLAWIASESQHLEERAVGLALVVISAVILLVLPVQVSGLSATIRVADSAIAGERPHAFTALAGGARRFLPVLGTVAVGLGVVVAAFVFTPVLVAVGILGLAITGLLALVRRRREHFAAAWPAWQFWGFLAIPFAVLWRVAPAAVLAPAAAVLEPAGPIAAMRAGETAARDRRWTVLGVVGITVIVALGLSVGAGWLGGTLWGEAGASALGGIVQLIALPLPIVASVALYRRAAGPTGRMSGVATETRRPRRTSTSAAPIVARIAVATVVTLVVPFAFAVAPGLATPAAASGAASPGAYVVTSPADTMDATTLDAQRASCLVAGGDCTIRAALSLAERNAADGLDGVTIAFAGPTDVALVAPLTFAPDGLVPTAPPTEEPPIETPPVETPPVETPPVEAPVESSPPEAPLTEELPEETPEELPEQPLGEQQPATEETPAAGPLLENSAETSAAESPEEETLPGPTAPAAGSAIVPGLLSIVGGAGVVLDGGGAVRVLSVASEHWNLDVSGIRFAHGWVSGFGGGLSAGVQHTTLTSTVFEGNTASFGGGAVFARDVTVAGSSFIGNRASGWTASTYGGAIRAGGAVSIVNSTFSGSGVGDEFTPGIQRGSDVYADATMTVVNSTFLGSEGGSLVSAGGNSTVRNSLFSSEWNRGGILCAGSFVGGNNRSQQGDTSCPGTAGVPAVGWSLLGPRDDSGIVPVFPLTANGNPAVGAGADCPLTDALGTTRPATGCDLGAVEFDGATSVVVDATPSATEFGSVTLRATVSSSSGANPGGAVTFTLDGNSVGSVALDDPADSADDPLVAELVVSNLEGGRTYSVSAQLDVSSPFDDSVAAAVDYTVEQVHVGVTLSCATDTTPGCATRPWRIADNESLALRVVVDDGGRDGSVLFARDAAGTDTVAGPVDLVNGEAELDLAATDIGGGASDLYALYSSDDDQLVGVSSAHPVLVLLMPTVTITSSASSGIFGDPTAGSMTVTVSGSGPTPTGTVSVLGRTATLDAAGTAVVDLSRLTVTDEQVDVAAEFWGDDAYAAGTSNTVTYRTTRVGTTVEIDTTTPATPGYGESVTVPVRVTADAPSTAAPQGTMVLVVDGTTTFDSPSATQPGDAPNVTLFEFTIPAGELTAGGHELSVEFTSNGNSDDGEAESELTVAAAATVVTATATPNALRWGQLVTLSAQVDAPNTVLAPLGSITFGAGQTTLGSASLVPCAAPNPDGCAIATIAVDTSALGIGTAGVVAAYAGTGDFAASSGVTGSVVVTVATPTVTITSPSSLTYGSTGDVSISVSDGVVHPADGTTVTLSAVPESGDAIPLGEGPLSDGSVSLVVPTVATLPPGTYTITAAVAGGAEHSASVGTAVLTVTAAATDIDLTTISGTSVVYGRDLDVVLTVDNDSNALAPEGDVVVTWSGIDVGRATLSAADDTGTVGQRTVTVTANFGAPITSPSAFWLTARFEPATGFGSSQLSEDGGAERQWVTVEPLSTVVAVDTTAVLGHSLDATASVSVIGDSAGVIPGGWITFTVIGSGLGDLGSYGPVPLVDGRASLADAVPAGIPVTLAGTWSVRATYTKDANPLTSSSVPNNTAVASDNVSASESAITVTAPPTVEFGLPFTVDVDVLGAVPATGTVRVEFANTGLVISDDVALVGGKATVAAQIPSLLAFGSHELRVWYSGNGTLTPSVSDSFTVTLEKTMSSVVVSTSSQNLHLYPGIVGATVQYTATVTTTIGEPVGFVDFYRGSVWIGQDTVVDGVVSMSMTADTVWAGDISAVFTSSSGTVASATGTLAHSWITAPVVVSLNGPANAAVGSPAEYTPIVRFDWADFQFLPAHLRPSRAPVGVVTVTDGAVSCSAVLAPLENTDDWASGTCSLDFPEAGEHTLTAEFAGDSMYAEGSSSPKSVAVTRGVPTLTLSTPQGGTQWGGLATFPVAWSVEGPSAGNGTIAITLGSRTLCTSTSLTGSCDVTIPAYGSGVTGGDTFTLEYSGSPLWLGRSTEIAGTIVACVPFTAPVANPVDSAVIQLQPAPNCGDGSGYYASTSVNAQATAGEGRYITSFADRGWPFAAGDVTLWNNGAAASVTTQPKQIVVGGQLQPLAISVSTRAQCVPVTFTAYGIPSGLAALNILNWNTENACGHEVRSLSGNTLTASFEVGARVRVSYQDGFIPDRTTFYQWDGPASDKYSPSTTFTVDLGRRSFGAVFGPVCYAGGAELSPPAGGTLTVSLPEINCSNPRTGSTGWTYGTQVSGELVDEATASRTFFDSWTGDTDRVTFGGATVRSRDPLTWARPFTYAVQEKGFILGAQYGRCVALSTEIAGDRSKGTPGTLTIDTPSNCPLGTPQPTDYRQGIQSHSERWFREGTTVAITTKPVAATGLRFLGWGGLGITGSKRIDASVSIVLVNDVMATATYGTNANCRPITISSLPAGALTLDTSYGLGANACEAMYGPKFYDQGIAGNAVNIWAEPATALAEGSEIVYAWATSPPGSPSGQAPSMSNLWQRTPNLSMEVYGDTQVVAYACQFVEIGASVRGMDGLMSSALSSFNTDRATQTALGGFVGTPAADCSVGADPRSGYAGYGWLAGTRLLPIVTADSVAYRFTGWSGDVGGTNDTPDAPLELVGYGRTADGGNYHARITANFDAICYTLSLPSDSDKVEVVTAPNCPGVDASKRMYLGGTEVVLHAPDKGDTLFRHWASGTDTIDADPRWASVSMTSDRTVIPYYSDKSVGEQFSTYGGMVGDALAVTSKKFVGLAAATVSAYFKVLISKATLVASGIGYIAQGLEHFGVEGAAIDAMKNASSAMNSMISMLFAPLDCITAWSAGGENTAIYAAQNLIGSAVVAGLSSSAQKPTTSTANNSLSQLQAQATKLKDTAKSVLPVVSAITSAKSVYEAAASGNIGWESSAYEAWGSRESFSVYSTCMTAKAGGMMTSVMAVGGK